MLRRLINETAESCSGDELADLATAPRDSEKIVVGARTKNLGALHQLERLERLSVVGLNQHAFDGAMAAADPRLLVIWDLKADSISAMSGLRRTERLVIFGANKVTDIAPLGQLENLQLLSLERMPKARDLSPLAALTHLEHLCFAGGHYASPKRVASLLPLAALVALRSINLIGVTAGDHSLEPLAGLPELVEISLSNSWPVAEFARLSVLFPNAGCEWFAPYVEHTFRGAGITGFGKETTIYITGTRKPSFSKPTSKDWENIADHVKAFEALQKEFRQQYGKG